MITAVRVLAILSGWGLIGYTFLSAMRTFVLPRSTRVTLTRYVFSLLRRFYGKLLKLTTTYAQQDALMATFAPLGLLLLVPTWLLVTTIGYTLVFWGMGITPLTEAFLFSGSSILTLGFATADTLLQTIVAFTEATVGLILVAMLISYLPTMYSAFSRREAAVSLLDVRAGIPPTAPELIWRLHSMGGIMEDSHFWSTWEMWFTELDETHTSLAALVFFRSPLPHQSWVAAAGTVLDGAALQLAVVDSENGKMYPALVLRAGIQALRHIADFFQLTYNEDPHFPDDPIAVSRAEFDEALERLAGQGVAIKSDREMAWLNFAGWRVNYDNLLIALSNLTMAPAAPWLSDFTFAPADPSTGRTGGELKKVR